MYRDFPQLSGIVRWVDSQHLSLCSTALFLSSSTYSSACILLIKLRSGSSGPPLYCSKTLPNIVQCCSTFSSMSDISRRMPASRPSPPFFHYIARALFRLWNFLAALLPKPTLASSSARSSLITAQLPNVVVAGRGSPAFSSHQYLTTMFVHLYSLRAVRAKTRGTMLRWHFSLDLP